MIAIAAAVLVHRQQERVGPLQQLQSAGAVVAPGEGIRQVRFELVDDAGAQQEVVDGRRLVLQHLLDQIVSDRALVPGEAPDKGVGVGMTP